MHTNPKHDVRAISQQFALAGPLVSAEPYGSGHINDTYRVSCAGGQYILQRINHAVFKNPVAVMENIHRVTTHLHAKLHNGAGRALTLVPTRAGQIYFRDAAGNYWRAYLFIDRAHTYDAVERPQQAYQAARAFGRFQQQLADLPAPRLHDTIPDFHHTPKRFAALLAALGGDVAKRAALAKPEIDFALRRQALTPVLVEAGLPERITHNDTKFNNVMLDDVTGEGMCVIDLDTVMPGLVLYDFGDMVRTTTSPAKEDERDLAKVTLQLPMFEALVRGYLSTAGEFLTAAERRHLVFAGMLITFEIGIRFLTDFLNGDTYFKTHRENHNLDRARTQFRLVESIEQQTEAMERVVAAA
ncbi:MAG: N-acetylhexosamine 1-kinase [Verrucomicrobiae bacterium]|nr:N-acetylhexosamine 1-kinase [Verrucomicrobiae bacterium]